MSALVARPASAVQSFTALDSSGPIDSPAPEFQTP